MAYVSPSVHSPRGLGCLSRAVLSVFWDCTRPTATSYPRHLGMTNTHSTDVYTQHPYPPTSPRETPPWTELRGWHNDHALRNGGCQSPRHGVPPPVEIQQNRYAGYANLRLYWSRLPRLGQTQRYLSLGAPNFIPPLANPAEVGRLPAEYLGLVKAQYDSPGALPLTRLLPVARTFQASPRQTRAARRLFVPVWAWVPRF
ncbi:hypothetical protein RSAG8_13119, partial [Rhizoctonia solani AG-8 WAC10335]